MIEREIFCEDALTPAGWSGPTRVCIDDRGFIAGIESLTGQGSGQTLRGPLVPGMPNLHSHAFQRQMAGLTETGGGQDSHFWTWREAMYRVANRINPEQLQAIAAWLQAEMLEAGFTSCAEFHYLHHRPDGQPYDERTAMSSSLLGAADATGMALTLLPVLYCRSGFGAHTVSDHQRRFFNTPEGFMDLLIDCVRQIAHHPRHRVGWAPHSLRAVSPDQLEEVLNAESARGLPLHIHVAEQAAEVDECLSFYGARPVQLLLDRYPVDSRWCLVHATHMIESELRAAARSGAVAGLCSTTEADLGDGFFDAVQWLASGGKFGIGSDSNLRVCVSEELRLLEFGCRLRTQQRNVLADEGRSCGRSLFQRAVEGGAEALGQPVGRIEAGCRADLVELDSRHVLLAGRQKDALLDSWIFAGGQTMVRSVWVGGELRVEEGRHRAKDELAKPFRRAMKELA